jgi:hypothetical protein
LRGQPDAPLAVGVRLAGHDVVMDDVAIEGTIGVGVDVEGDGSMLLRGCRFSTVGGVPLRIGDTARPVIRQSLFVRPAGEEQAVAIEIAGGATPELVDNLLVGYRDGIRGPSEHWVPARREQLFRDNYRIPAPDPAL